jgi:hypothetical protein
MAPGRTGSGAGFSVMGAVQLAINAAMQSANTLRESINKFIDTLVHRLRFTLTP